MINEFQDFTEQSYSNYLDEIRQKYKFLFFHQGLEEKSPHILWRHDIDASVHRALKLAQIEHEKGIHSTFFVLLQCPFYRIKDPEILTRLKSIHQMGHKIGLHFDSENSDCGPVQSAENLKSSLKYQKEKLEKILGQEINIFSYHVPEVFGDFINNDLFVCDMLNVYATPLKQKYTYCSDSNGLWRYKKLADLIDPESYPYLHILTHPEWWVPSPLSPRNRIKRCLEGYSENVIKKYDELLEKFGRPNF